MKTADNALLGVGGDGAPWHRMFIQEAPRY